MHNAVGELLGRNSGHVLSCRAWHIHFGWEELYHVNNSVGSCFVYVRSLSAEVVPGWTNIPSIHSMRVPASALIGFLMGDEARAWWGHWCFMKIRMAIKLGICGYFLVESGLAHKVWSYSLVEVDGPRGGEGN
jgi:hypothetical protein